ncbi:Early nodulin-like protein 2 [Nymphaea thermarum]|nr:Early nodulin-like protein 2 [Nymphaea thermarum]
MACFTVSQASLLVCAVMVMLGSGSLPADGFQFRVGGSRGWIEPTGNDTDVYNDWASENRFHVGDSVYFEYKNDSVLVVDGDDYGTCDGTYPIYKFKDGHTTFTFDRFGFFYFISGNLTHCLNGQRLIVRVMHILPFSPGPLGAPAPQPGDGDRGGDPFSPAHSPPTSSSASPSTGLVSPASVVALAAATFVVSFSGLLL